jgi:phage terminase small subunit
MYALGDEDKEDTYDRAMAQVAQTNENFGMSRLLSIVTEGKGASNRLTTAESMVIEQPTIVTRKEVTSPVLNVAKDAKPSMIGKYFKTIEQEIKEAEDRTRDRTKQLAERVANKINHQRIAELSTDTLGKYKKAAAADAKKADADGDYARGDKRFKGINKATSKQFDNDLKKHGQQAVSEAEGTPSGVAHLTKELLTHIVQQSGKEGAHAVVKSLTWGDGAAKELLHLIINDLKDDIAGMDEAVKPAQQAAIAIAKKKAGKK